MTVDGSVTLAPGDNKVCTITNDDRPEPPATITLIKHVINDDGGDAIVSDFDLFLNGQQVTSGVATTVDPGTYSASETNLSGYTASAWSGHCAANGTVTVAAGEDKVCQITNDDQPSTITLVKRVDGGDAKVSDF